MSKLNEVNNEFNLVEIEKNVLEKWKKENIFEKVKKLRKDESLWVYYDGPITANGIPHYGHAITWTMKDVLPRYWTMKGYNVPRNIGWDCQGILVEYEVEKKLDFKEKSDIEEYGIDKFNNKCRESVLKFRESMIEYETRLGRWLDDSQYSTMDKDYIESMWWSIKELYSKGLLYEGHKVVAYSTRAGMTLSSHEVAEGGYSEIVDPAVTVKFKLVNETNTYLLAWTTTPWTLPGNLMLSVGKKIEYVRIEVNGEFYILAKDALERNFEGQNYKVVEIIKASELVGLEYIPLYEYFLTKKDEGAFKVIFADHVNTDEGTGIVHLAPYGEEDFNIFLDMGIGVFDYLDDTGHFSSMIPQYEGQFYKKANKQIIEELKTKNLLLKHTEYSHQMPMCYRTKEPLIYKPIRSWYVAINKIKPQLIDESKKIKFVPPEMGSSRFVKWIENARDWSLSRRRYWGTPLPIWVNDETQEVCVIGSFEELERLSGQNLSKDFDPHKPFVDEISWKSDKGGTFRRVVEVIDVWYDSGSMPFAQYHYPFENKELFNSHFPAEYISEGDDQLRLWFYTMFVLGVALFNKSPFKNVVVIGMLGDSKGKKMSKSKGNYPPIEEVFEEYGSDMLRYFLLTSGVARGAPAAFSYESLLEAKKDYFLTYWNSYRYFITYAKLFNFTYDSNLKYSNILDRWIISRYEEFKNKVDNYLSNYEIMLAAKELSPFIQDLSTWYIRRSRDRISSGDKDSLNLLYYILIEFTKNTAPFTPLLAEDIYSNLKSVHDLKLTDSVHMAYYPIFDDSKIDNDLLTRMKLAREIASLGNSIRKEKNISLKQPLEKAIVLLDDEVQLGEEIIEILNDELNIKNIQIKNKNSYLKESKEYQNDTDWVYRIENNIEIYIYTKLSDDLIIEGYARELIREIQKLRKESGVSWDQKIKVQFLNEEKYLKAVEKYSEKIKTKTLSTDLLPGSDFRVL